MGMVFLGVALVLLFCIIIAGGIIIIFDKAARQIIFSYFQFGEKEKIIKYGISTLHKYKEEINYNSITSSMLEFKKDKLIIQMSKYSYETKIEFHILDDNYIIIDIFQFTIKNNYKFSRRLRKVFSYYDDITNVKKEEENSKRFNLLKDSITVDSRQRKLGKI
jgi:hypothetical protein